MADHMQNNFISLAIVWEKQSSKGEQAMFDV